MKKLKTLITTFTNKLCKFFGVRVNAKVLWMEVPSICECRADKDEIIMTTIEHLEHKIKIK